MVRIEDHHLRRSAGLAAALDHARERIEAFHERNGPGGGTTAGEVLSRGTKGGQITASTGAKLEQHPFGLGEGKDGLHRVLYRIDEAGRALRLGLDAHVEPDWRVERGLLSKEQILPLPSE